MRYAHQYAAAAATHMVSGRVAKKYGIKDAQQELNNSLAVFLDSFGNTARVLLSFRMFRCFRGVLKLVLLCMTLLELKDQGPFHGGDLPSFADVLVFGTIRSVSGFEAAQIAVASDPAVSTWYKSMEALISAQQTSGR